MVECLFKHLESMIYIYIYIYQKMSGQSEEDKHIKCKGCNCKYVNDEHKKQEFGYSILGEQIKTCVTCRNKRKVYNYNKVSDTASTTTPHTIEDDTYVIVMDVETHGS